MKFAELVLVRVMGEPIKLRSVLRGLGHLASIAAIGLAVVMISSRWMRRARSFMPLSRSHPATPNPRSSAPLTASPSRDQKPPSQTDDAAREDEVCLEHLRAVGVAFTIPMMPAAAKAGCTIEAPVRLKVLTPQARGAAKVDLPEEPVVCCQFAERRAAWLGDLVAPLIADRMFADLRAVRTGPGCECRNRNGAAKLSAHAVSNAITSQRFELSSGKLLPIKPDGDESMREVVGSDCVDDVSEWIFEAIESCEDQVEKEGSTARGSRRIRTRPAEKLVVPRVLH